MKCFVFDVDGVLTHPLNKQSNPQVLAYIGKLIESGNIVAFNTGRSFEWLRQRVLDPLGQAVKIREYSERILCVCEMGNITYKLEKDTWVEKIDPAALIPEPLRNEIKSLTEETYSDSMFFDDKKTMVSVEIRDGYDSEQYLRQQKKLLEEIDRIVQNKYKNYHLKTASNLIALDVQNENSGKKLGAEKVIDWIKKERFEVSSIITFGDNSSDLEMAEAFIIQAQKEQERSDLNEFKTEFVYVGKEADQIDPSKYPFPIIFTQKLYDSGTLEYFKNQD